MRKSCLIFLSLLILVFMFMASACNKAPESGRVSVEQTIASTAEPTTAAINAPATEQAKESQPAQYNTESDELEILTPDQGSNSGNNTPESETQEPAKPQTTTPQFVETMPTMENISDEPIELPFVPFE